MLIEEKKLMIAAVAAAGILTGTQASAALTVDDFVGDKFILDVPDTAAGPFSESLLVSGDLDANSVDPDLFGDERTFSVSVTQASGGTAAISILGVGGVLALDSGANAGPGDADFGVLYEDFTDVDVTEGGANDAFSISVLFTDGSFDFTLTLDDGTNSGSASVSANSAGLYLIDLSDAGFAGVDLTSIDSINFEASNGTQAADIAIDRIAFTVIPEPGSMALLGLGGLLLARRRRA